MHTVGPGKIVDFNEEEKKISLSLKAMLASAEEPVAESVEDVEEESVEEE